MTALPMRSAEPLTLKGDFPSLSRAGAPAYFDTASSAQKPQAVIDTMRGVMESHYANVHRGLYDYSMRTTEAYEAVRARIARFINASGPSEVVFTRNATEGFNLIAFSWGLDTLKTGDEVILTEMEHHANIVPWQILRDRIGIVIKVIPVTDDGRLEEGALESLLSERTRAVSIVHMSNSIGTVNPVRQMIETVKRFNPAIITIVDASQAVVHGGVDVQRLGCDFICFTGHKLYGPSGVGILWGREALLNAMPPYQGGGDMIETVAFDKTIYKPAPARFEAGTPSIVDVIGLGAAIDYIESIGMEAVTRHEEALSAAICDYLKNISGVRLVGHDGIVKGRAPIISFIMEQAHPSDIGMILDQAGIAVRTGHHCCMPLMQRYEIDGTVRVSVGLYNDWNDVDRFTQAMGKVRKLLG